MSDTETTRINPAVHTAPACMHCAGRMRTKRTSTGNVIGIAIALFVLATGVVLTSYGFWWVGVPMCIVSLFMGGKRQHVWRCDNCGYSYPRT